MYCPHADYNTLRHTSRKGTTGEARYQQASNRNDVIYEGRRMSATSAAVSSPHAAILDRLPVGETDTQSQLGLLAFVAGRGVRHALEVPHDGLVGELELELREEDGEGDLCGRRMGSAPQLYEITSGTYSFRVGRI